MKIIQKNKKAYFDYEVLDEYKAGIILTGPEIKAIRSGNVNLKGAYVSITKGEAFIKNMNISRYKYDSNPDYDPFRMRKLLLKESELHKIANHLNTQGVTVVPLAIGLDGKYAKVQIGIVRGKKKHDKRQTIKERDIKKQIGRTMKKY
ncbi:SsrA-binding protein SmpB [Patescibacteria group bacterium]|nr:SsrA-binding protein SmpB [Patescibacteria group bacterium]MBU1934849.1 SsrA-binding protein SmpB [Patescibacteria group bacterium]